MSPELLSFVRRELAAPVPDQVRQFGESLARDRGAVAVLFYGSILRTGDLSGVLDYYLLTPRPLRRGVRALAERWLWPEVSYHQMDLGGETLRAKAATLPVQTFRSAAGGLQLDTTIWTRFVQPSAVIWSAETAVAEEIVVAVAAACETAARFAAALGPQSGSAEAFWLALFRSTYQAELRMEDPTRSAQILAYQPERYRALLPLAWASAGIGFDVSRDQLTPKLPQAERRCILAAWAQRRRAGKPLNVARLIKATFTFEGAARYAAWKIERHTGLHIEVTPWRERHPLLAAPIVVWKLWRARRRQPAAR
ncbi:hypothetical protein [Phenylobacterium deserti]|uniref:Uncharacterized protein n=1 Tax=Phenylobacterium deserti TaxID=1914756 RepID=A0A328AE80_9CAUL|nr:hypothetical protein [Phenylobacterium deserti]RAK52787.1 hypothetical protein DJ018_11410 [Phenylobacterium deserti]